MQFVWSILHVHYNSHTYICPHSLHSGGIKPNFVSQSLGLFDLIPVNTKRDLKWLNFIKMQSVGSDNL